MESGQPTASASRSPETRGWLLNLEIHRGCFPVVLFDLIIEVLPFIERAQSSALDRGDVDEYVFAAGLRLDESVALRRIEPLHGAARHFDLPSDDPGCCYFDRRLGRQGDDRALPPRAPGDPSCAESAFALPEIHFAWRGR